MNKFILRKDMTKEEVDFLNSVGFPTYPLSHTKTVQKRTKRQFANGGYFDKQVLEAGDEFYMIVPTQIAKRQIGYKEAEEKRAREEGVPASNKHKAVTHDYIFLKDLQAEADRICRLYCTPKATPSMAAAEVKEVEAPKKAQADVKGLSNKDKSTVKKMYQDEEKDSKEIAEALGVDEKRVIEYLKKLS